jgi:hypothetical protein
MTEAASTGVNKTVFLGLMLAAQNALLDLWAQGVAASWAAQTADRACSAGMTTPKIIIPSWS